MTAPEAKGAGLEWQDGGGYDAYVGSWSRMVAQQFVGWLAAPGAAGWVDIGCGTGALLEVVLSRADPASIHGLDPASEYVARAQARARAWATKGARPS